MIKRCTSQDKMSLLLQVVVQEVFDKAVRL